MQDAAHRALDKKNGDESFPETGYPYMPEKYVLKEIIF